MPKKALDKKSIPQGKYTNISKINVFSFVFSLRTKKLKTKTKKLKNGQLSENQMHLLQNSQKFLFEVKLN